MARSARLPRSLYLVSTLHFRADARDYRRREKQVDELGIELCTATLSDGVHADGQAPPCTVAARVRNGIERIGDRDYAR